MKDRIRGLLAAYFNYFFIGLSFLFTKNSVLVAPTFVVLSFRFILSLLLLTPIIIIKKQTSQILPLIKTDGKLVFLFALVQPILFFTFQALALQRIDSSEAGVISSISPAIVAILAFFILKETLSKRKIGGLVCTLGGLIFIFLMKGAFSEESDGLGLLFILLATFSASFYQLIGRKLSGDHDPLLLAYFRIIIGTIIFPLLGWIYGDWQKMDLSTLENPWSFGLGILYLAFFTTVITSILTIYSLKRLKAAEQGIFASFATIVSILAGILFLQETFLWYEIIGSIIVIIGVILMNQEEKESEISDLELS